MSVTDLDSDIWDPRGNSLASQQTILPTSRWIDIQHLSCIFYLLSSSSSRPNRTTPSAPPAPASHGWLCLRRPTVRTLQRWPVPPSIPPHILLFSGDISPSTHPHLNLRLDQRIFHGSCSFRLRPRRRPPPYSLGSLAVHGAPPSCIVNIVNNREEQGDECTWRG